MQLFRGLTPLLYTQDRDQDWMKDIDARAQFAIDFGKKNRFVKLFFVIFSKHLLWLDYRMHINTRNTSVSHNTRVSHIMYCWALNWDIYISFVCVCRKKIYETLADLSKNFIDEIGRALENFLVW